MAQRFTGEEAIGIFMNTISPGNYGPQQQTPGITPPVTATGKDARENVRNTAAAATPTFETGVRTNNANPDNSYKDNYNPYRSTGGSGVTANGTSYDIPSGYDWGGFIAKNQDINTAFGAQGWTNSPDEYAQWWAGAGAANNEDRFINEFGVRNPISADNGDGNLDPGEDNRTADQVLVDNVIGGDLTDEGGGRGSKLPNADPGNLGNKGDLGGPGGIYGPTQGGRYSSGSGVSAIPKNVAGEVPRSPSLRSVRRASRKRNGTDGQTDVIKTSGQGLTNEANTLVKTLLGA